MADTQKRFYGILVALAAVGIGALLWLMNRSSTPAIPAAVQVQPSDTAGFAGYVLGSDSAPVTITEYADFQCPACQSFDLLQFPDVKARLIETGKVRYVYKDYPIDGLHPWARLASHAAACANDQGRFWEMHASIYRTQADWSQSRNAGSMFRSQFEALGGDMAAYDACMSSLRYAGRIQATLDEGIRVGVGSTPTFVIGQALYVGAQNSDQLRRVVDSLIALQAAAPTP